MAEPNLSNLLQQAQALQEKLKQLQEEAAGKTVEAQSGGGMVKVTVDGSMQVRRIQIDPALLTANDQPMLEDLITVAVNEGLRQAQKMVADEMGKLSPMGMFKFPGLE